MKYLNISMKNLGMLQATGLKENSRILVLSTLLPHLDQFYTPGNQQIGN